MTIVGNNEIYRRENPVEPFLVHKLLGPIPPLPPLPVFYYFPGRPPSGTGPRPPLLPRVVLPLWYLSLLGPDTPDVQTADAYRESQTERQFLRGAALEAIAAAAARNQNALAAPTFVDPVKPGPSLDAADIDVKPMTEAMRKLLDLASGELWHGNIVLGIVMGKGR